MPSRHLASTLPRGAQPADARIVRAPAWGQCSPEPGSLDSRIRGAQEQLVGVPQRVVIEHRRMKISYLAFCAHENIRSGKKYERHVLGNQLLHAIVELFTLAVSLGNHLQLH